MFKDHAIKTAIGQVGQPVRILAEELPYKPVPVSIAHQIADTFNKSQVVILSYDPVHQLTHTTTYGVEPWDKENAAAVGNLVTAAIGCDLGKTQTYEDFHQDYRPANYKRALGLLHDANIVLNAHAVGLKTQEVIGKFLESIPQPAKCPAPSPASFTLDLHWTNTDGTPGLKTNIKLPQYRRLMERLLSEPTVKEILTTIHRPQPHETIP